MQMTTTTSTFARRGASSSLYSSSSSSSSNTKVVSLFFFRSFNSLTFLFGLLCSFMCARVHTKRGGCPCARARRISTRCFNTLFFLFSFFFCARDLVSVFNKNHPLTLTGCI